MKYTRPDGMERKLVCIKKRYPWVAELLEHCLKTRRPEAYEAMRMILSRLRLSGV